MKKPAHAGARRASTSIRLASTNDGEVTTLPRISATVIRLPLFRDGVFIGNEFVPISPRLRARIRQIAAEGRA